MKVTEPNFYLASSEGYDLEEPRRCWRLKRLASARRNDLLLIKIEPPLLGQKFGLGAQDLDTVLVATRYEKASLFPINEWPLFVHVARLLVTNAQDRESLGENGFQSIAWAELYRSEQDARLKDR